MQGHGSSVTTLPENLSFDNGSTSSDAGIDSQISWNTMPTSPQNRLQEYRMSSDETNIQYLHHVRHEGLNGEWSLGESSSHAAQSQGERNVRERQRTWNIHSRGALTLEERRREPWNIFSSDSVDVNGNGNQTAGGLFMQALPGHGALTQDLNMHSEFGDHEDVHCQIVERPDTRISIGSSNEQMPSTGSSSDSFGCRGYALDESEDRPGCSLDGRRISCKRKALEVQVGQSSGAGSSSCSQHAERSQWHSSPAAPIADSDVGMSTQAENDEQANPRPGIGVGAAVSSPFCLSARGTAESSRRNFRLRISGSHQQDHIPSNPFSTEADVGNADALSSQHSSRQVRRNRLFDLSPLPSVENETLHRSHAPFVRRNPQSRWSGASSSRTSSTPSSANPDERDSMLYEESTSRNIPRSISEHPMFVPPSEMGSSSQQPTNWSLPSGNNSIAENVASASRLGSTSGVNSSAPSWSHRSWRLSEIVRRSLISSVGSDSGGQSSNHATPSSSLSSGSGNHGHHISNSRAALLERHLDGAFGIPYSLRNLAAAGEGRSSIMSEQIRHVLDLMRRGEGLRFEDVMILDHSVLFGMTDVHDRHRDMRLDVDNMSYEELLALEERIGNVCTGLSEETILSHLKLQKYIDRRAEGEAETETEPCSICREEYNEGEDVGTLDCGHDFH
ncbi:hypothetical protein CDL12_06234 [Handroanthus impetiginosus]|uniref:RING-type E3 ubiquitin transferase n=1 Tax=Handroanthus impetiginosus TaxID=429701 RepID=A0A2G9HU71_9LAMI|nr:hypothetical protein CDL12_06234 [Handroanthus impetiginosus]